MNNKQAMIIKSPKKVSRSVQTVRGQQGVKTVRKVKGGCCLGGSLKK